MTFLRLNGWQIKALVRKKVADKFKYVAENGRRWTNRPNRNRRTIEQGFEFESKFAEEDCADTLIGLVEGEGDHFPFVVDAWSEAGLGPEDGSNYTLSSSGGPLATRGRHLTVGAAGITYNPELIDDQVAPGGGRWAVLYWYKNGATWEWRCVRSDGTKFQDGVRNDPLVTTELSVTLGAVFFVNTSQIADLVILPYWPCDEFVTAVYAWLTANDMQGYWRFNGNFVDELGRLDGTATAGVAFAGGKTGHGITFGAADVVDVGGNTEISFTSAGVISLEALISPTAAGVIVEKLDTAVGLFGGYSFRVIAGTVSGKLGLELFIDSLQFQTATANDALTIGEFSYVEVDFLTFGTAVFRVNGVVVSHSVSTVAGSATADTANPTLIGNNAAGTNAFSGIIDEVRVSLSRLSTAIAAERWISLRSGRPVQALKFFSALPRVDGWGDKTGWRNVELNLEVTSEKYQRGTLNGAFHNNLRTITARAAVTKSEERHRLPSPDFAWELGSRGERTPGSSTLAPLDGFISFTQTVFGGVLLHQLGPFNFIDSAMLFDGTGYLKSSSSNFGRSFAGATGLTVMMWVKRNTLGAIQVLLAVGNDTVVNPKFELRFTASNRLEFRARTAAAEALVTTLGTVASEITDTEWHLIGAQFDFVNDTGAHILDGHIVDSSSVGPFANNAMSDEGTTENRVASDLSNANKFDGSVGGMASIYKRLVSSGEIRSIWERGKRGEFS